MKDTLFDTKEKVTSAISHFTNLLSHPGWQLVEKIVGANIDALTEQILKGGESKEMNEARYKLQVNKDVIGTPQKVLGKLRGEDPELPDPDPYPKLKPEEGLDA